MLSAIIVLGCIGLLGAMALYAIARKFHVDEDPRIDEVADLLPGANCGGCGMKGCRDFATQCVQRGSLDGMNCPVAGAEGMQRIALVLGCGLSAQQSYVAVVRCAGTPQTKVRLDARYVGPRSCAIMNAGAGDYECRYSCLGCGDCVKACKFGAMTMDQSTGLPTVDADKCTGCGQCVTACPRHIIELRPTGPRNRRVWVACSNCLRGALTRKQCSVGCIACSKCVKTCPFEAITIVDNHAYIDPAKCRTCGKCIPVCPTHAIHSVRVNVKVVANETANVQ